MIVKKAKKLLRKKLNGYEDIEYNYLDLVDFKSSEIKSSVPRINLVLPKINKKYVFGGISTAIKFFEAITKYYKYERRIIVTDIPLDKSLETEYPDYKIIKAEEDYYAKFDTLLCATDPEWRKREKLAVRDNDYFIMTSWRTKYVFENIYNFQQNTFGKAHDDIYLIQDYEPGFFEWSSEFLLVDSTYKSGHTVAVFNSYNLEKYFKLMKYHFIKELSFEPVLNNTMAKILLSSAKNNIKRRKRVLLYGRPYVNRNCFSLAVEAINTYINQYSPDSEWEFISIGEDHKNVPLNKGFNLIGKGKLTLNDYAELLLTSRVGISLMCSPHPSYPPLEMSTFGLKTVTNSFQCKDLKNFNNNIISIDRVTFKTLAAAINKAVIESEKGNQIIHNMEYVNGNSQFNDIVSELGSYYKFD